MSDQSFVSKIIDNICDAILFCMPGHNGKLKLSPNLDITELDFSDNLQNPMGIIKGLEDKIAKIYGADATLLFTSGATSAIAAALATAKQLGSVIAIDDRAHKSVYAYAKLLGLDIVNVAKVDTITEKLAAILITTPDYLGKVYDCTQYSHLARQYNIPLIVDQSHGAHYIYSPLLPDGQEGIADITINSLHKTMPVLTGGAIANVRAAYAAPMRYNRALLHTTSPSYLIMSSIDLATDEFLKLGTDYYLNIYNAINTFKYKISRSFTVMPTDDFSRLIIKVNDLNSNVVSKILASNKVYIEMTYNDLLVLIITPYNYQYLPRLAEMLDDIALNKHDIYTDFCAAKDTNTCQKSPLIALPTNIHGNIEFIAIADAVGRTVATDIGIYPPGVPLINAGEALNAYIIKLILDNQNNCFGLVGGTVACLRR